jgi:anti-anti-sigma factor
MRTNEFEIRESPDSGWRRVTLLGELDMNAGPELEERLHELRASGQSVLLDLSQLNFMDSTGLTIMIRAINSARGGGWDFVIDPSLSPQVRELFDLTALDRYAGIDGMDPSFA